MERHLPAREEVANNFLSSNHIAAKKVTQEELTEFLQGRLRHILLTRNADSASPVNIKKALEKAARKFAAGKVGLKQTPSLPAFVHEYFQTPRSRVGDEKPLREFDQKVFDYLKIKFLKTAAKQAKKAAKASGLKMGKEKIQYVALMALKRAMLVSKNKYFHNRLPGLAAAETRKLARQLHIYSEEQLLEKFRKNKKRL